MALDGTTGRHRIYLVRHGAVSYFDAAGKPVNPKLVELTDDGREQARTLGQTLAEIEFDRVVCSGLPRTRQTAELITAGRDVTIEDEPKLSEIRGGRFTDIPPERREAELVYGFEAAGEPGARFAGGEAYSDFAERVTVALTGLLLSPGWSRMLIAAHDAVNRVILGWASGAGLKAAAVFEQDMACLNVIDVDIVDGEIIRRLIKVVNYTPYNPTKHGLHLTSMEQIMRNFAG